MPYYVLQVKTKGEDEYLKRAGGAFGDGDGKLIWPRRNLRVRRKGNWNDELAPIFPGYLFLEAPEVTSEMFMKLRRIPGFFRFLQSNQNIIPLSSGDRELLMHFLSFGEIVEKSSGCFDENNKIKIISGPLLGLEGFIVKVDRRKGRVKVKLGMFKNAFLVDFGFEAIEKT